MNIASNLSGHWTDEQLIEHLYGVGLEASHIDTCDYCRQRLADMKAQRRMVDTVAAVRANEVPADLLAAQRRSIYARLERESGWMAAWHIRRWAATCATVAILGGATFLFEQQHTQPVQNKMSDAQLVQEVSQIASDQEPAPVAPLQGLFDD
jgi:predicted anti-sigma-YlaC factor YlaD